MNKIIKTVKKEDKSFDSSALRRANANIEVYSPEELAHFGVRGMRWGVRKDRDSGGSGGSGFQLRKSSPVGKAIGAAKEVNNFLTKPDRDFMEAAKTTSKAKAALIYTAMGPHFGAKYLNSQAAKAKTPEEKAKAAKKEMKVLRNKIIDDFAKRSDAELAAHEREFRTKYGRQPLKTIATKEGRQLNRERAAKWSEMLTSRMEKMLNDVAKDNLAGTDYKINSVQGFNDFTPTFIITNGKDSVKHSDILEHADISWKMDLELDEEGFLKSMKIPESFLDIKDEEVAFVNMPDEDGDEQDENDDEG